MIHVAVLDHGKYKKGDIVVSPSAESVANGFVVPVADKKQKAGHLESPSIALVKQYLACTSEKD